MAGCRISCVILFVTLAGCAGEPTLELPTPGADRYTAMVPQSVHAMSPASVVVAGHMLCSDGSPEGLVLMSHDGGKRWRRTAIEHLANARLRFDCISFSDHLRGWIAGVQLAEDGSTGAVVFRTEDGGNHWRSSVVPMQKDIVLTGIQSLKRDSDADGVVVVRSVDEKSGKPVECAFKSTDGGRSWMGLTWMQPTTAQATDHSSCTLGNGQGFRVKPGATEGCTVVEITGNSGTTWMPVSELSLAALATYYR